MQKRQVIIVLIAALILAAGIGIKNLLAAQKKDPERKESALAFRLVRAKEVANDTLIKRIPVNGKLTAKNRVEIFPEVTGTLLFSEKPFKVGQKFSKGEVLLAVDGNENLLNLKAQRSAFINVVSQALPDIKIDYSSSFDPWKKYLDNLTPDKSLPELPEVTDNMLKNFLSGRNIYQQYFSIKSLENRQSKFTITAPFNGSVSMGSVNAGTVIRAGQKVGEFIQDEEFEYEAAVAAQDGRNINVGDEIVLNTASKTFNAKITRVASNIDPSTQRIALFATLSGDGLKEGAYLEGFIETETLTSAMTIDRNLIHDGKYVFLIKDTVLVKKQIDVAHEYEQNALVTGLTEGEVLLNQVIDGAYDGMLVKIESK